MERIALLVGNNNYKNLGKLKCCINDVLELEKSLKKMGFETIVLKDVESSKLADAVSQVVDFINKEKINDFLFYFAGHGFQMNQKNYLACIDTVDVFGKTNFSEGQILYCTYNLDFLFNELEKAKCGFKIVILDACRTIVDNVRGNMSSTFAPIDAPIGTIVEFSTSPGQSSLEDEEHGYFTKALLKNIDSRNIPVEQLFKNVRKSLYEMTNGKQISWEHTSLLGDFIFNSTFIMNSNFEYSKDVLGDIESYEAVRGSKANEIIQGLLTFDFYKQNPAIDMIDNQTLSTFDKNDLFALGRLLVYALYNNVFSANKFISNLSVKFSNYREDISSHILNGILYGFYYNSKGEYWNRILNNQYISNVLSLLNQYENSIGFIQKILYNESKNHVLYIPGVERPFVFDIYLDISEYGFYISKMLVDGKMIDLNADDMYGCPIPLDESEIKKIIKKNTLINIKDIKINLYNDTDVEINSESKICLSEYLSLSYK